MTPRSYARKAIRPEMTVRQVAADFPNAEEVFRKHGEHGAPPARFGHLEPLTHFARRQNVPTGRLLSELAAVTGAPIDWRARFAERVHHPFLLASLALTLTLGAGWGAWLLWQIGAHGDFSGASAAYIIAHGEAQLWGFIVLFVMGIALRTVLHGAARHPKGAWVCHGLLLLALVGITGSIVWSLFPQLLTPLGVASAAMLCLMALGVWTVQIALLHAKWRATWARAVLISGFWLTTWGLLTAWLRWKAGDAGPASYTDWQRLLLIELAVLGFAMNSIYGFGQMLLPGLLRIGSTRDWAIETGHWLHNAGVTIVCLATGLAAHEAAMVVGSGLLVGGAVMFAVGHRGFIGRRRTSQRDEQGHAALDLYPPLAFFWLLAALLLMTAGALYESVSANVLHHAYTGAVRHALTVGFMTTLMLGVAQRLVPVLDRTILAMPKLTIPILALIGIGNLTRVGSELATLVTPAAFRVMPVSAVMEWLALLLFTLTIVATMYHRDSLLKHGRVTGRSSLAVLLAEHRWIEERLRPLGTGYLERARSVPDELTIGSFAASERLDPADLVDKINEWLAEGPAAEGPEEATLRHAPQHKLQRSRP